MGIKEKYYVERISYNDIKEWILKKHYAHCIPTVVFSFGLFNENKLLSGICTFGMACANEYKAWLPYKLYELNRFVCINKKNIASFFLSQSIKNLKNIVGACVLVSYSDIGQGHSGYIYQATNWIYTGICGYGNRIFIMKDGSKKHNRHYKNIDLRSDIHRKVTGFQSCAQVRGYRSQKRQKIRRKFDTYLRQVQAKKGDK